MVASTLAASGSPLTISDPPGSTPACRGLPLKAFWPVRRHIRPSSPRVAPSDDLPAASDDPSDDPSVDEPAPVPNTHRSSTPSRSSARSRLAARHQLTAPPSTSGPKLTDGGWRWPLSPQSVTR